MRTMAVSFEEAKKSGDWEKFESLFVKCHVLSHTPTTATIISSARGGYQISIYRSTVKSLGSPSWQPTNTIYVSLKDACLSVNKKLASNQPASSLVEIKSCFEKLYSLLDVTEKEEVDFFIKMVS